MTSRSLLARLFGDTHETAAAEHRYRFVPRLEQLEERVTPSAYAGTFAVAVGGLGAPHVQVYQVGAAGGFGLVADFFAYDQKYVGGVSVGVGDIDGDGVNDVVTCSKLGVAHVEVFRGVDRDADQVLDGVATDMPIASFYAPGMPGGNVAVGNFDTTNDGADGVVRNEIAIGAAVDSARVQVFRNTVGRGVTGSAMSPDLFSLNPVVAADFTAFAVAPAGGVSLAAGNLDNSTTLAQVAADELVVGTGSGAQGMVNIYNFNKPGVAADSALSAQFANTNFEDRVIATFLPFGPGYAGGLNLAVGNVIANSPDTAVAGEIIVGMQTGAALVNVFQTTNTADQTGYITGVGGNVQSLVAFDTPLGYMGGVNVGFNNVGGGAASILVAPGQSLVPPILGAQHRLARLIMAAQLPGVFRSFGFNTAGGLFVPGSFGGIFDLAYHGGLSIGN